MPPQIAMTIMLNLGFLPLQSIFLFNIWKGKPTFYIFKPSGHKLY